MTKNKPTAKFGQLGVSLLVGALMTSSVITPVFAQDLSGDIRFAWWGATSRNAKAETVALQFEEKNPGVSISREPGEWGSYWDKLTVQSASGNQPCVITMQSRWLAQYADPAILTPLDDLVASGALDVSGIDAGVLESGRGTDGNLYFIPHGVFYFVQFMNTDAIEAAGMELPTDDMTWEEYGDYLRELATKLPEGTYAIGNSGGGMDPFTSYVQGHGETLFNADGSLGFTKDTVVAYFNFWESLRADGVTEPADQMAELPDAVIENTLLANGKIVIDARPANQIDAHQKVLEVAAPGQNLEILHYPNGPEGHGEDLGSNGLAIGATCGNPDAAVAFINHFTQDADAAATYASDNGVVSVDRYREAQLASADSTVGQRAALDGLGVVGPRAKPAFYPAGGYAAMYSSLTSAYESVAFGSATAEDAAEQMISQVERLMRD